MGPDLPHVLLERRRCDAATALPSSCCPGLEDNEWVAAKAFNRAIDKTRAKLGRWYYVRGLSVCRRLTCMQWTYGGDEVQVISDLIMEEINWNILWNVYAGLSVRIASGRLLV